MIQTHIICLLLKVTMVSLKATSQYETMFVHADQQKNEDGSKIKRYLKVSNIANDHNKQLHSVSSKQ
jgi:UDP-glucose 4-epimerase